MRKNWTTSYIPDLTGKTMIITEGDNTLGYEATKAFAAHGGLTILGCRDMVMGERIREDILKLYPGADIRVMTLELSDPVSIRRFGDEFNKQHQQLDVLMNISSHQTIPAGQTAQVFGRAFGSDQAGHMALTALLLGKLASTPGARVVNLSLGEHKLTPKDFSRVMSGKDLRNPKKKQIGSSRWANLLFTYELQRFFDSQSVNCTAVAAWPGPSNRNLERRMKNRWYWRLFKPVYRMFTGPDPAESALPGIRAALASDVKGGEYYGPGGFVESTGYPSYNAVLHFVA